MPINRLWPCLFAILAAAAFARQVTPTADPFKRGLKEADFPRAIKLADNVYAYEDLRSAGKEKITTVSLFVVTTGGVLVADGQGTPAATARLVDAIGAVTKQPIKYVIVCSDHGDHTGGNVAFPPTATFIAHPTSKATLERQASAPNRPADAPKLIVPTEVVPDKKVMKLGSTEIQVLFLGRAHTGGDLHVYLPKEKVLFMSEAYLNRVFPAMRSAYPAEWVAVLRKAERMDVRRYVPGHGFVEEPAASKAGLIAYRKALEAVIAEVARLHKAGASVEDAIRRADFGEYASWAIAAQQAPIAVRKVYEELSGQLK